MPWQVCDHPPEDGIFQVPCSEYNTGLKMYFSATRLIFQMHHVCLRRNIWQWHNSIQQKDLERYAAGGRKVRQSFASLFVQNWEQCNANRRWQLPNGR